MISKILVQRGIAHPELEFATGESKGCEGVERIHRHLAYPKFMTPKRRIID